MSSSEQPLTNTEHTHEYNIIVNGRHRKVVGPQINYEQVVKLAFDDNPPTGENVVITVTYSRGEGGHREGSLLPGQGIDLKDGMVFDVTATDRS
jgi:hypothetical protein